MSTPAAEEKLDAGLRLVIPGRGAPLGAGWDWVARGWQLFVAAPLMWILAVIVLVVIAIAMALIPIVGQIAFQLMQPVFSGGLVVACRSLERGEEFEFEHLFAGFTRRFGPLMVVGLLFLLGWLVIAAAFFAIAGLSLLSAMMTGDMTAFADPTGPSVILILLALLVMLALMVPLMAAYWFAPALVMMHDMAPVAAMKASFFACFRNFLTFAVYGIVMTIAAVIAMIPFGLGMLVWIPVAITSTYVAYRQIFTEDEGAPAARAPMVG